MAGQEMPLHELYPEEVFSRLAEQARRRDAEHEDLAYRAMGRIYHLRDTYAGRIELSDIVTQAGRDLYLEAAKEDEKATAVEDIDGTLSDRQAEARNLPVNFRLMYVSLDIPFVPRTEPESRFWDYVDDVVEPYDPSDTEMIPKDPETPGMLTHRAVYGLAEGLLEVVRSI